MCTTLDIDDDLLTAVAWGDAAAQWQLGDAYHHGQGVTQDDR